MNPLQFLKILLYLWMQHERSTWLHLSLGQYFVIPAKEVPEENDKCPGNLSVSESNSSPPVMSNSIRKWGFFISRDNTFKPRSEISILWVLNVFIVYALYNSIINWYKHKFIFIAHWIKSESTDRYIWHNVEEFN